MKINIEELQVKRARTPRSITAIRNKYDEQLQTLIQDVWGNECNFPYYGTRIILIKHKEEIVGSCITMGYGIYVVGVKNDYRGNNISYKIVANAIEDIKKHDIYKQVRLESDNPIAQHVYEKMGFYITCETEYSKNYRYDLSNNEYKKYL